MVRSIFEVFSLPGPNRQHCRRGIHMMRVKASHETWLICSGLAATWRLDVSNFEILSHFSSGVTELVPLWLCVLEHVWWPKSHRRHRCCSSWNIFAIEHRILVGRSRGVERNRRQSQLSEVNFDPGNRYTNLALHRIVGRWCCGLGDRKVARPCLTRLCRPMQF